MQVDPPRSVCNQLWPYVLLRMPQSTLAAKEHLPQLFDIPQQRSHLSKLSALQGMASACYALSTLLAAILLCRPAVPSVLANRSLRLTSFVLACFGSRSHTCCAYAQVARQISTADKRQSLTQFDQVRNFLPVILLLCDCCSCAYHAKNDTLQECGFKVRVTALQVQDLLTGRSTPLQLSDVEALIDLLVQRKQDLQQQQIESSIELLVHFLKHAR